jgi:hypothetical protein
MNVIHKGTYSGANLKKLIYPGIETKRGYDNRIIIIENYINRSNEEYYAKSLEEKGWDLVNNHSSLEPDNLNQEQE